jgi:hypothetical protein
MYYITSSQHYEIRFNDFPVRDFKLDQRFDFNFAMGDLMSQLGGQGSR